MIKNLALCFAAAWLLVSTATADAPTEPNSMNIDRTLFGTTLDKSSGETIEVYRYRLTNASGATIDVCDFGATLLEVMVPDRQGNFANVNLCFDSLDRYVAGHPYFGSTVGRYANRIGGASFSIDGQEFQLTKNHGQHILHGGKDNFAYRCWKSKSSDDGDSASVTFSLHSAEGDNGFPGNVDVTCTYRWNNANELTIELGGTTDAATHLSMTNHSYWNLSGVGGGKIHDHQLQMPASETLEVDEDLIPHGGMSDVTGTPFDFRVATNIGSRIDELPATKGYDHCYVVPGEQNTLRLAAQVMDPKSGRAMQVETTLPGIQLYTANHLGGGEETAGQGRHDAFCLETQMFPNSPNVDSFPTTLIRPGEKLTAKTVHRFSVSK